jgi:Tetratricopeptide repeat/Cytochrome c554 and c-prime
MALFRTHRLLFLLLLPLIAAAFDEEAGSQACSRCHAEIYRKYSATSMARSSGKAGAGPLRESFEHATFSDPALRAEYHISEAPAGYRLEFSRMSSGAKGQRMLEWFVGSGRVGRSYISSLDGFLFQAPVSYYSRGAKWDLSPGYQQHEFIHLTRAVGVGCLQCHASRLQPVAGTQNRFTSPPFLEGGVSCERCHGPGKNHVTAMTSGTRKAGEIVNPAKLEAARRDSVCAQCHLTGAARIARVRAKGDAYQAGRLLSDYAAYFVWSGPETSSMSANSHFEKLQQSGCKRASGDRLWCGSCHDPHTEPAETERADFYRTRCQKCHEPAACKGDLETRRQAQNDCIGCHMPKGQVRDTEHAVFTDHTIPRREGRAAEASGSGRSLGSFWKTAVEERDLGLAYATVAGSDSALRRRAFDLLRNAEARDPKDVLVLAQLAQFYDQMGDENSAMALSERVIRLDPAQVPVAVNLGTYYIKRGRAREAMRLWTDALSRNPGLTSVRMNLAVAQYQAGDPAGAETTVVKLLEYDPDQETARQLLSEIRAARR